MEFLDEEIIIISRKEIQVQSAVSFDVNAKVFSFSPWMLMRLDAIGLDRIENPDTKVNEFFSDKIFPFFLGFSVSALFAFPLPPVHFYRMQKKYAEWNQEKRGSFKEMKEKREKVRWSEITDKRKGETKAFASKKYRSSTWFGFSSDIRHSTSVKEETFEKFH